jgi:hypothetical protein
VTNCQQGQDKNAIRNIFGWSDYLKSMSGWAPLPAGNAQEKLRGNNWLLVLQPESSEEQILKALEINGQKGFADCALIFVESTQLIENKKVAILHPKRSVRKVQVERTFLNSKFQFEKLFGSLDQIKDTLRSKGYSKFHRTFYSQGDNSTKRFHQQLDILLFLLKKTLLLLKKTLLMQACFGRANIPPRMIWATTPIPFDGIPLRPRSSAAMLTT